MDKIISFIKAENSNISVLQKFLSINLLKKRMREFLQILLRKIIFQIEDLYQ